MIGEVDVVASVPPDLKEPLEADAGMGSTLVNNTFIYSLVYVKLSRDANQCVIFVFLETLTHIVREAVPS